MINPKLYSGKVLWTNPNPTNYFVSQNVDLTSDDYDILEIFYIEYQNTQRMLSQKTIKGHGIVLDTLFYYNNSMYMGSRNIDYVSDTRLLFGTCRKIIDNNAVITPAEANNWIIPQYIIGYKTELF